MFRMNGMPRAQGCAGAAYSPDNFVLQPTKPPNLAVHRRYAAGARKTVGWVTCYPRVVASYCQICVLREDPFRVGNKVTHPTGVRIVT